MKTTIMTHSIPHTIKAAPTRGRRCVCAHLLRSLAPGQVCVILQEEETRAVQGKFLRSASYLKRREGTEFSVRILPDADGKNKVHVYRLR